MAKVAISFPALCFNQGIVVLARSEEELTTCTSTALKRGWFDGLKIVDATGQGFTVKSATKIGGVGPLGGFGLFARRIRVELELESDAKPVTLDQVKKLVARSFRDWEGWSSRGDFKELQRKLADTSSIEQVFELLRDESY